MKETITAFKNTMRSILIAAAIVTIVMMLFIAVNSYGAGKVQRCLDQQTVEVCE